MSELSVFNFDSYAVRTLTRDGEPWFVAADVCEVLTIGNPSLAVNGRADREGSGLDEDERGIAIVNTPSGEQEVLVINESGLYSLILTSRELEVHSAGFSAEYKDSTPLSRFFGRVHDSTPLSAFFR